MKKFFIISIALITVASCKAQLPPGEYTSQNKKAIALFKDAIIYFQRGDIEKAKAELAKAIEKDANFIEPHLLLAQIFYESKEPQSEINEYIKVLEINPKFDKKTFYNLANAEYSIAKYNDAKKDYEAYLKYPNINPNYKDLAEQKLANCIFAIEAIKNPVPFEPKNMGDGINSVYDEYFPAITADAQTFLFTRNNRTGTVPLQEDFLISKKENNVWGKAILIGDGINTSGNEGAPSLSSDGQILFFVACAEIDGTYGPNRKGLGSCDIFYTQKVGSHWSRSYNIGPPISSKYYETQPSFSADGKTLYFVSNRPGGMGATDIYVSTLQDNGAWGIPRNLGNKINTKEKEESVFIHPDGKTLYFGSAGHTGMGGLDIFVSRMDDSGQWGDAVNIGYPINTNGDENSLLVGASGDIAYFASNRAGGYGGLDLYQFDLYETARPGKITYLKGKVYDAKTNQPLGAHFELIDLATAQSVIVSDANSGNGEFLVTLPVDKNYALNVTQPGYLFYSENFALKELKDKTKPFLMNVPLLSIDTGSVVELKNVFFETAKFDLKPESKVELNKLVAFLNLNKTLRIELSGHTDNVGDKKMNLTLSQNRSKSVYDYLIANGIDAKRLTYKGYGDTQPKVKNDSDEHRAMNRRTEFKVIGK
jgi:outer membrane protein OmpA-like peptidoglycan-associated protein/Tol biopolymer transport system component